MHVLLEASNASHRVWMHTCKIDGSMQLPNIIEFEPQYAACTTTLPSISPQASFLLGCAFENTDFCIGETKTFLLQALARCHSLQNNENKCGVLSQPQSHQFQTPTTFTLDPASQFDAFLLLRMPLICYPFHAPMNYGITNLIFF